MVSADELARLRAGSNWRRDDYARTGEPRPDAGADYESTNGQGDDHYNYRDGFVPPQLFIPRTTGEDLARGNNSAAVFRLDEPGTDHGLVPRHKAGRGDVEGEND